MVEQLEIEWQRRLQAAAEAIELLNRSGFKVGEFDIEAEPTDPEFTLEVDLSVGEQTFPLEALEDEDNDDLDLGDGFALGVTAGMMISDSDGCGCRDQ